MKRSRLDDWLKLAAVNARLDDDDDDDVCNAMTMISGEK